jgi:ABC-type dipeptide/oligopeptide/nickel transport system permease component
MRVLSFILGRLAVTPIIILGLITLVFFIVRVIPSDPIAFIAGERATKEQIVELKQKWGLDQPLYTQYFIYLRQLAKGDFGTSFYTHQPVVEDLMRRLPATLELTIVAVILSVALGVPIGIISALGRNSWFDHLLRVVTIGGLSIVGFWLGIMLQMVIGYQLNLLPLTGRIDLHAPQDITGFLILDSILTWNGKALLSSLKHLILPATAIAFASFAVIARFTRAGVLNVLRSDYVLYEQAMGLPYALIIVKYVLRNSITSTVTQIGLVFASLLGGAAVIEMVFEWPGLGNFLVQSILLADYKVILGVTVWIGLVYIFMNLIIDIAQTIVDPRRIEQ